MPEAAGSACTIGNWVDGMWASHKPFGARERCFYRFKHGQQCTTEPLDNDPFVSFFVLIIVATISHYDHEINTIQIVGCLLYELFIMIINLHNLSLILLILR